MFDRGGMNYPNFMSIRWYLAMECGAEMNIYACHMHRPIIIHTVFCWLSANSIEFDADSDKQHVYLCIPIGFYNHQRCMTSIFQLDLFGIIVHRIHVNPNIVHLYFVDKRTHTHTHTPTHYNYQRFHWFFECKATTFYIIKLIAFALVHKFPNWFLCSAKSFSNKKIIIISRTHDLNIKLMRLNWDGKEKIFTRNEIDLHNLRIQIPSGNQWQFNVRNDLMQTKKRRK